MQHILPTVDYIHKMDSFISEYNTGNKTEFANKMNVSPRCLSYDLADYKQLVRPLGCFVIYNNEINSYQYTKPGHFKIILMWQPHNSIPGFIVPNYHFTIWLSALQH